MRQKKHGCSNMKYWYLEGEIYEFNNTELSEEHYIYHRLFLLGSKVNQVNLQYYSIP